VILVNIHLRSCGAFWRVVLVLAGTCCGEVDSTSGIVAAVWDV